MPSYGNIPNDTDYGFDKTLAKKQRACQIHYVSDVPR